MSTIIEATFDGNVFRPSGSVPLVPNTVVRLIIEPATGTTSESDSNGTPASFLQIAREMNLQGPADWATNLDQYLRGKEMDLEQ
jgi:hypothetical protein